MTAEHVEQDRLQAVVGARGMPRRRPNAVKFFANQIGSREMLFGVAPQPVANGGVENFREALREPAGKRLQQDVAVSVDGLLERLEMRLEPMDADPQRANPVRAV